MNGNVLRYIAAVEIVPDQKCSVLCPLRTIDSVISNMLES